MCERTFGVVLEEEEPEVATIEVVAPRIRGDDLTCGEPKIGGSFVPRVPMLDDAMEEGLKMPVVVSTREFGKILSMLLCQS